MVYVRPACTFNVVREIVGSTFGIGTGVVGIGDGIIVCILLVPSCTV